MPLKNNVIMHDVFVAITMWNVKRNETNRGKETTVENKEKHTVGLEPTISCSVGKRLIQLGYACSSGVLLILYSNNACVDVKLE